MYKMRWTFIAAALLGMLSATSSATLLRGESLINTTLAIYNASVAESPIEAPPTTGSSSSGSSSSPTSSSGSGSTSTGGSSSGSSSGSGSSGSSSSSAPPSSSSSSSSGANTTSYTVHHPRYITRSYARRVGL